MKKKLIISIVALLVFPSIALAYFQPATLTDGVNKVVVTSESQAKTWFAQGYHLFTGESLGALTSNLINSNYLQVNKEGVYYINGTFLDATTTIVTFANPFGSKATATVDMVRLIATGAATTTYTVQCGATAKDGGASDLDLLSSGAVATSTPNTYLENNLTNALGATADGGTVAKVALNFAYPYFTCFVTGTDDTAFTNVQNTFAGRFSVRISRNR